MFIKNKLKVGTIIKFSRTDEGNVCVKYRILLNTQVIIYGVKIEENEKVKQHFSCIKTII